MIHKGNRGRVQTGTRDDAIPNGGCPDLAAELRRALSRGPGLDYEQLRADLDATIDPGPKDWYEWAARTDRHVCLGRLEGI